MSRLDSFNSAWGSNWVVGQTLLPLLQRLGETEHGNVLDLGCGESPFRGYFKRARKYCRVDRAAGDPEIVPGDMLAIPYPDGDFDMVLLFQALTDVPQMEVALKEVRRVLRPGGRLVVFESMCYPEHDAPYDYYRLMPEGLRWLGTKAGFRLDELVPLGGLFARFASLWSTFIMGRLQSWRIMRPLGAAGIMASNLVCLGLDRLLPHPRLAPDYIAVLSRLDDRDQTTHAATEGRK